MFDITPWFFYDPGIYKVYSCRFTAWCWSGVMGAHPATPTTWTCPPEKQTIFEAAFPLTPTPTISVCQLSIPRSVNAVRDGQRWVDWISRDDVVARWSRPGMSNAGEQEKTVSLSTIKSLMFIHLSSRNIATYIQPTSEILLSVHQPASQTLSSCKNLHGAPSAG